ncbi:MAG: GntR family transcriptional regulator [Christensenellales bacterium]|jgi:DNA-binding GntR family transcriptional regulator
MEPTKSRHFAKGHLRDHILEKLEKDIVNGKYPPGTKLTEKALCEEFEVSRTPLREAFYMLERTGLIEIIPNKGIRVIGVSQKDIDDIYTIKGAIDGLAARLAAERITKEELAELKEVLDLTEFYVAKDNSEKVVEMDTRFHEIVLEAGRNRPLRQMLNTYHKLVRGARNKSLSSPERQDLMLAEHKALYEAIAAGDGELAGKLSTEHAVRARGRIAGVMRQEE